MYRQMWTADVQVSELRKQYYVNELSKFMNQRSMVFDFIPTQKMKDTLKLFQKAINHPEEVELSEFTKKGILEEMKYSPDIVDQLDRHIKDIVLFEDNVKSKKENVLLGIDALSRHLEYLLIHNIPVMLNIFGHFLSTTTKTCEQEGWFDLARRKGYRLYMNDNLCTFEDGCRWQQNEKYTLKKRNVQPYTDAYSSFFASEMSKIWMEFLYNKAIHEDFHASHFVDSLCGIVAHRT